MIKFPRLRRAKPPQEEGRNDESSSGDETPVATNRSVKALAFPVFSLPAVPLLTASDVTIHVSAPRTVASALITAAVSAAVTGYQARHRRRR